MDYFPYLKNFHERRWIIQGVLRAYAHGFLPLSLSLSNISHNPVHCRALILPPKRIMVIPTGTEMRLVFHGE